MPESYTTNFWSPDTYWLFLLIYGEIDDLVDRLLNSNKFPTFFFFTGIEDTENGGAPQLSRVEMDRLLLDPTR